MPGCCCRQLLLTLLSLAYLTSVIASSLRPQFYDSRNSDILLTRHDEWRVSSKSHLAFISLSTERRILIELSNGRLGESLRANLSLLFKCPGSAEFSRVRLSYSLEFAAECKDFVSFTLNSWAGRFDLEFSPPSKKSSLTISEDEIQKKLELKVEAVDGYGDPLLSGSLFLYNPEALFSMSPDQRCDISSTLGECSRVFTKRGVQFLATLNDTKSEYNSIDFIEKSIVRAIGAAPDAIRSRIYIAPIIELYSSEARGGTMIFLNHYLLPSECSSDFERHRYLFLDMTTGKLHFAIQPLARGVGRVEDGLEGKVDELLLLAMINMFGESESFASIRPIWAKNFGSEDPSPYRLVTGKSSRRCHLPVGLSAKTTKIIYTEMGTTPLVCPIICSDENVTFSFSMNGRQLSPLQGEDWTRLFEHDLEIHRTSVMLMLPSTLTSSHSGEYVCSAGGVTFTYNIQVVSLPHFPGKGSPPHYIFAIEGEQLMYKCSVEFINVKNVAVNYWFETNQVGDRVWSRLSVSDFNKVIGGDHVKVSQPNDLKSVQVDVKSVPREESVTDNSKRLFTHRFVCAVKVSRDDTRKIGMEPFTAKSSADVISMKRPTAKDFTRTASRNCLLNGCPFAYGDTISVKVSYDFPLEMTTGAEVTAYFKLNNKLLAVGFEFRSNNLSLTVDLNRNKELLDHLMKGTLTPVFNFHYKYPSNLVNLKMHKDRYGEPKPEFKMHDCLANKNCFYSTEFDSQISESLTFKFGAASARLRR